jgi:hypothetical protein
MGPSRSGAGYGGPTLSSPRCRVARPSGILEGMTPENPYQAPESIGNRGQAPRGRTSIRSMTWRGTLVGATIGAGVTLLTWAVMVATDFEGMRTGGPLFRVPAFILAGIVFIAIGSLTYAAFGAVCGCALGVLRRLRERGGAPR